MPDDDDNEWSNVARAPDGTPIITINRANPNLLPIQPDTTALTSDPATGVAYPTSEPTVDTSQVTGPIAKLLGIGNEDRYQLWPEKLVRSAFTAPADAIAGNIGTPDQEIGRALDMTSLMGTAPLAESPGVATLGSGMTRMAPKDVTVPTFYSAVENAVNNAKLNVGTTDQWLGYLKNQPGVKQEELDYTLGNLPAGQKLTKADMQNYVDANKVQLNEVQKVNQEQFDSDAISDKSVREHFGMNRNDFDNLNIDGRTELRNKYMNEVQGGMPTKYQSYQLPGGDNYREQLLTIPSEMSKYNTFVDSLRAKYGKGGLSNLPLTDFEKTRLDQLQESAGDEGVAPYYKSSHWDEPNILAHVRMNDRNVEGNKTLHLEEIQSDWHQAGRQQGYKITPEQKTQLENIDSRLMKGLSEKDIGNPDMNEVLKVGVDKNIISPQEAKDYATFSKGENSNIPNAPFKNSWSDLVLKRMIRHAAQNGYDAISWTPGEAQAARYDLSKHIDKLQFEKSGYSGFTPADEIDGRNSGILKAFDKDGRKVIDQFVDDVKKLPDYIGKEAASKLLEQKLFSSTQGGTAIRVHKLEGQDLKIGSEGMEAFYDKMLVDKANSLAKKYGGKVEDKNIDISGGKTLNSRMNADNDGVSKIHFLKLPQELKDVALHKGFPLFSGGAMITPVVGNPWEKKYKLNKVDHNPFEKPDYDYEGAKEAGVKQSANGHWPDTYKLPNHITFSDESKYSNQEHQGGHWEQIKDDHWKFTPSKFNLTQHSPQELQEYFKKYESQSELNLNGK